MFESWLRPKNKFSSKFFSNCKLSTFTNIYNVSKEASPHSDKKHHTEVRMYRYLTEVVKKVGLSATNKILHRTTTAHIRKTLILGNDKWKHSFPIILGHATADKLPAEQNHQLNKKKQKTYKMLCGTQYISTRRHYTSQSNGYSVKLYSQRNNHTYGPVD